MKKLIALVLAVMMMALCFAGCQTETPNDTTNPPANSAPELKTGDKVVIVCTSHNMALSSVAVAEHYLSGVEVTVTDGVVSGYGNTEVWTVTKNDDGSYSFEVDGQKLSMQDQYNSMNLGYANDKWELVPQSNGTSMLKNTVRGNFVEWYASKSNWSTYTDTTSTDLFQLSFFVVG